MSLTDWFSRIFKPTDKAPHEPPAPAAEPNTQEPVATATRAAPTPAADPKPKATKAEPQIKPPWWEPPGDRVLAAPEMTRATAPVDRTLYDHLCRVLNAPDLELPRLPQIIQRALLMLQDENVNFPRMAELVEQDPAVTASVLKVVNSAAYRGINEISRLELAFARLGRRKLRSLLLSMSMQGMTIRTGGPEKTIAEQIWRRMMVGGIVCEEFCAEAHLERDESFLLGMLHDIGMLAVLRIVHDYQRAHGRTVSKQMFACLVDEWHEHIGLRLADAWNLPAPMPEIIGHHHRQLNPNDAVNAHRALVQLSDVVAALLGFAKFAPYDFFKLPCTQALGLTDCEAVRERLTILPNKIAKRLKA